MAYVCHTYVKCMSNVCQMCDGVGVIWCVQSMYVQSMCENGGFLKRWIPKSPWLNHTKMIYSKSPLQVINEYVYDYFFGVIIPLMGRLTDFQLAIRATTVMTWETPVLTIVNHYSPLFSTIHDYWSLLSHDFWCYPDDFNVGPSNRLVLETPWTSSLQVPIGSMYAIYGNIYHQYTPNVSIYTIHGSYGVW